LRFSILINPTRPEHNNHTTVGTDTAATAATAKSIVLFQQLSVAHWSEQLYLNSCVTIFINTGLLDGKAQYSNTDASTSTAHAIARGTKRRIISSSDILAVGILVIIGAIVLIISL
jgi:hypothetical protein